MLRVIVTGANGHMGRIVRGCVEADPDMEVVALVDAGSADPEGEGGEVILSSVSEFEGEADVVIDFSHHDGTKALLEACTAKGLPIVLATTGQTEEELAMIDEAAKSIAIFRSANMSVGVALVAKLVNEVAASFSGADIEIVETHHNRKIDAPSGTAIMLAEAAKEALPESNIVLGRSGQAKREKGDIGVNSVRMGNIVGTHEVMFGTNTQTITIKHEAHDRGLFADGAIDAAKFIAGKEAGKYNMDDLLA